MTQDQSVSVSSSQSASGEVRGQSASVSASQSASLVPSQISFSSLSQYRDVKLAQRIRFNGFEPISVCKLKRIRFVILSGQPQVGSVIYDGSRQSSFSGASQSASVVQANPSLGRRWPISFQWCRPVSVRKSQANPLPVKFRQYASIGARSNKTLSSSLNQHSFDSDRIMQFKSIPPFSGADHSASAVQVSQLLVPTVASSKFETNPASYFQ